ncbi:UBX domain-containing protein 2A [Sceloporus undulatus]|uniref:UBX domain-containing protein 2A n=1 Tax=Sceloporus undulatus TaxID=8520 RepID=UPI001C4A775E|nr:UBX domain-containing protein 2A [Sceloporus undulatus]
MQEVNKIETLKQKWVCTTRNASQIQNGTDQKSCDIFVDNLFEEAQKVRAVCTQQAKVKSQVDTTIKLWKNGFTVNDGELRSYTDVANQRFLDSVKKGELPPELQKICEKEEVDVKVDDKKDELYTVKKPVFHPFSGQGYRLGSATPRVIYKVKRDVEETEKKKPTVVLNYSEPITSIQIWLADGTRIVQKFNISHRISHVRDFITTYQGHQGRSPFILTTSLPFRELLNESLTLEEADLKNAVVVQRLKTMAEPFRGLS